MRRSLTLLAACAATLVLAPNSASAQNPQTRQGFFIGFGFGAGSLGVEGGDERETGGAGILKLGGTLNSRTLIGADISAWTKEEGGARVTHGNVTAMIQFYPSETGGFFLLGGVGLSQLEVSVSSGGFSGSVSDEGLGLTGGLGYDIRLGTNFSLSPYASFAWGNFEGGTANHGQLGLSAMFH